MKKTILFSLLAILTISTTVFADVKIKIRQTMSGQKFENTTYIKGKRQRSEMMDGQMITVTQCDLRRDVQMNPTAKTYIVSPYDDIANVVVSDKSKIQNPQSKIEKGGTMYITTTNKDTGERKQMFGYTARHIIQTVETESTPDSCNPSKSKMEIDAWVIDETFGFDCDRTQDYQSFNPRNSGGCRDKIVPKTIGTAKSGYPLYQKMTFFDDKGNVQSTMTQEVLELSKATLSAALFEVPSDYREVKDASEMYASSVNYSSDSSSANTNSYGSNNANTNQSINLPKSNQNVSTEVGAKKVGIVRIGMANVKVGAVGEGLNANDLSAAVQNTLGEYLKGTKVELVALEAKLPSAIGEEAKSKECDFVIYANVSHKKGGGGFGGFGKVLGNVVQQTGGGSWGNTTANVAGAVVSRTIVAATLSQNVKAKDEISLEIKLQKGESNAFNKQYKAKAKSDGEDILSPLIEQVAQAVLDVVGK
jgi:hypothetical protein